MTKAMRRAIVAQSLAEKGLEFSSWSAVGEILRYSRKGGNTENPRNALVGRAPGDSLLVRVCWLWR
jgi:hypothetical protein